MRFEEVFKGILKDKIVAAAGENSAYSIHAVSDLFFKAENFIKGDNDVIMVVQGGNVTKSNIPNYDLNTMPLIVNFIVPLIRKNAFMGVLGNVAEKYNGTLEETAQGSDNGSVTQFRAIYNTPARERLKSAPCNG